MSWSDIFEVTDIIVYIILFLVCLVYASILCWWEKTYPESYTDNTWVQVVVGCEFVILALAFMQPLDGWLRIQIAFGVASVPIVVRSLVFKARQRREANAYLENIHNAD